jgi:hypothetical protein
VNFFGHAAVAGRAGGDAPFILGAMAPDLLPLCGAIADQATSAGVVDGQAQHHRVDAVFHANPTFLRLQAWTARTLIERGVARGSARGAAHVGAELLLDGVLASDADARDAYANALAQADGCRTPFTWRDQPSQQHWAALIVRLRRGTFPDAYRDCDFVADRVIGALRTRPRLALCEADQPIMRAFLPALRARVEAEADALMASLVQA